VEADIADRTQAEAAVQRTVDRFGRLDILVNNAGLMLLGPVVDAEVERWDRMIAINNQGLLYTTHATLTHLLKATEDDPRQVADIVNISSIAGRVAWNSYGVYNMTSPRNRRAIGRYNRRTKSPRRNPTRGVGSGQRCS
jgi:NADP-dependent 3-hydroxy acid dehydrogenase YdfG